MRSNPALIDAKIILFSPFFPKRRKKLIHLSDTQLLEYQVGINEREKSYLSEAEMAIWCSLWWSEKQSMTIRDVTREVLLL